MQRLCTTTCININVRCHISLFPILGTKAFCLLQQLYVVMILINEPALFYSWSTVASCGMYFFSMNMDTLDISQRLQRWWHQQFSTYESPHSITRTCNFPRQYFIYCNCFLLPDFGHSAAQLVLLAVNIFSLTLKRKSTGISITDHWGEDAATALGRGASFTLGSLYHRGKSSSHFAGGWVVPRNEGVKKNFNPFRHPGRPALSYAPCRLRYLAHMYSGYVKH